MRLVHFLQHWLSGTGTRLRVTDFVPEAHPIRQWAETFPWAALVSAIEQSFQQRFPTTFHCGRRPVPIRAALRGRLSTQCRKNTQRGPPTRRLLTGGTGRGFQE